METCISLLSSSFGWQWAVQRERDRQTDRKIGRQAGTETETDRDTDTTTDRQRQRQRDTDRDRQRHRQTETHTHTHRARRTRGCSGTVRLLHAVKWPSHSRAVGRCVGSLLTAGLARAARRGACGP